MTEQTDDQLPPQVDDVHVSESDLAVQPQTVADRIRAYNKAIAAGVVNLTGLVVLVATGEDVDPEVVVSAQTLIGTFLVWLVRNH